MPTRTLLDCAVGVKVDGAVLLAVPTGGSRRGGYLSVGTVADAVRVRAALRGLPGFPRVRLNLSVHRDTCHTVTWGARQPWDDAARGRHFGYAPSAIDAFFRTITARDSQPEPAENEAAVPDASVWKQDPLLSTLRDVGGCLAVILTGVLISALVAAIRDARPLPGPGAAPSYPALVPASATSRPSLTPPGRAAR